MMSTYVKHIALVVPNLREAETFYQSVFDMELIGREAARDDGLWATLPFDKGWDEAEAAEIELSMVGLRKGEFVLALFRGEAALGQVYVIGLAMPAEEIAGVRARLPEGMPARGGSPDHLEFRDPWQITWQISLPGTTFRTTGDWANRWLEL
jgi:catechol 2,3-dioxygenase-like lactoylglutathione lyase family enzyme